MTPRAPRRPRMPHGHGGPRWRVPRESAFAWWRTRRGIRRRMFFAFGAAIALSMGAATFVHRLADGGLLAQPLASTLVFLAVFSVLWAFAGAVSARLALPVVRLAGVVRAFGEGELDRRVRPTARAPAEVRALGLAFDAMADRIEGQIRRQRELLAAVSHELRTPLARLRVVIALAEERGADARLVAEAEAELAALDELVGGLLAGARVDAGALSHREVDLVALAEEAVVRATEADVEKSYALDAEVRPQTVVADAAMLSRALRNLLDNARKHGGREIVLRVLAEGSIEVEDDGPGVSDADRERVFEPFVRGEGKAYDDERGVGLGLHLVRRIAEAHGARLTLTPVEPHGARFRIGPFPSVRPADGPAGSAHDGGGS